MDIRSGLDGIADWLSGLRLLVAYDRSGWRHDLPAGLIVTLVLIPSAIAYADLAKCLPVAGLYAALSGMVVYALLTTSRHVIVGPDTTVAILVGAAIGPLAVAWWCIGFTVRWFLPMCVSLSNAWITTSPMKPVLSRP